MSIKLIFAASVAVSLFACADDVVLERNPDGSLKRFTKKEFMEKPADYRRAFAQEVIKVQTGGIVLKPGTGKGSFLFVNGTKLVSTGDIQESVVPIRRYARINVEVKDGENVSLTDAKKVIERLGANAGIFLVDQPNVPRLLLAPEEGWGMVNVRELNTDSPSREKLSLRVRKEMVRAFTFVCGSASDARSGVTMRPVASLKDIDSIPGDRFTPSNIKGMEEQLRLLGIEPIVKATYRKACEEGWAPAPADSYQQAIWEKVHQLPSEPIKIKPEAKKVKE